MATCDRYTLLHKEIANIINDLAFTLGVNNFYDVMCSNLCVSKYININNIYCSDISEVKINILNAFKNDNIDYINNEYTNLLNNIGTCVIFEDDEIKIKHLIEVLDSIYDTSDTDEKQFESIDDVVEYNKTIHLERLNSDKLNKQKISNINLKVADYKDIDVESNSIVLCYEPFFDENNVDDMLKHAELISWINNLHKKENITVVYVSFINHSDTMEFISDLKKLVYRKRENNKQYLSLFISKNADMSNDEFEF